MKKQFKRTLALLLAMIMVFSCAACGEKKEEPKKEEAPKRDDLKVVISQDSGTLDPLANNGWDCIQAIRMIYEPLWEIDENHETHWVLATSVDELEPTRWQIHLRQGVKFANGNDFNADDVLFTITRANTRAGASAMMPRVLHEQCKKIDDYTVEVVFDRYQVGLFQDTWGNVGMMDAESTDEATVSSVANGTGPYEVENLTINSQWVLKAREGYWGDPAPFKRIEFQILTEDTQRVNALETGSADIVSVPFQDISYVESFPNVKVVLGYTGQTKTVYFNLSENSAFYKNDDARKAICYAIDRDAVINIAYSGYAEVSRMPIAQGKFDQMDSFLDLGIYKDGQNMDLAKEYAEKAGLVGKELTLLNNGSADNLAICEIIQDNLKNIGITVKIWTLDAGSWKSISKDPTQDWDFLVDFTMGSSIIRGYDMWSNMGGASTYGKYPWEGSERFLELKPIAITEPDLEKRTPMVQELTEILVDSLVWYSFCDTQSAKAYNKDLQNFLCNSSGNVIYTWLNW